MENGLQNDLKCNLRDIDFNFFGRRPPIPHPQMRAGYNPLPYSPPLVAYITRFKPSAFSAPLPRQQPLSLGPALGNAIKMKAAT